MSEMQAPQSSAELYLRDMKNARQSPAVLKTRLATLKSSSPKTTVFAFEGKDDKVIYYNWTKRVRNELKYEPFPCNGKKYVIQLINIIKRDLNNIGENVYIFLDRDFDENNELEDADNLYITKTYSIENLLINENTIDEILKNDLHCHERIELRSKAIELFQTLYSDFLQQTKEINYRLYFARRCKINLQKQLPDKANQLAQIRIDNIQSSLLRADQLVILSREPTQEEDEKYRLEFEELDPRDRYRGKFAMMFLRKWLQQLVDDRNLPMAERKIFSTCKENVVANPITLDSLASKSDMPECFIEFINNICRRTETAQA